MANREHVEILKQGVESWNLWREENPGIKPNLSYMRYGGKKAIFRNRNFSETNLSFCNMTFANFDEANFARANLMGAYLMGATLCGANLRGAELNVTNLTGADLSGAVLVQPIFANVDLQKVKGLERVRHASPSSIDIQTIYRSQGNIPEAFLRGAGVPDSFITYAHSLVGHAVEYFSCFISHSNRDKDFVKRLHADLQDQGVRCWFAPEDMKIGDKIRDRIDEAIHLQDKLLLLLSKDALASTWVEDEVEAALEKEQRQQRKVLFPIRFDEQVMQTTQAWAAKLRRTRHIGDFTHWTDPQAYQQALERLLRDLKAERAPEEA